MEGWLIKSLYDYKYSRKTKVCAQHEAFCATRMSSKRTREGATGYCAFSILPIFLYYKQSGVVKCLHHGFVVACVSCAVGSFLEEGKTILSNDL